MPSELTNPMRFSIRHRDIDMAQYDVRVTDIEVRPSEGQVYVYWTTPDDDTDQEWQADVLDRLNEAVRILDEHERHELAEAVGGLYQRVGAAILEGE